LASDLGLVDYASVSDIGSAVASYYMLRSVESQRGREIRNVVTVDEWVEADNCLFTNALAEWVVKTYSDAPRRFALPRDSNGDLVAYDDDPLRAYKQASAPLVLWPLERDDLTKDPIEFLERFEGKESPNGPAMSLSVYALIRARYGDADAALQTWRESWKRYTDKDLLFQEEPGREDLTYFNTGAAGCLNAVVYGFIGARVVSQPKPNDAKIEIENGKWLVFRPNLPRAWRKVTFKNLRVLNETYDVVCEGRFARIEPHP
jgi:trehalose/maltose hydrolase-like predicted phosphorylase